MKLVVSEVYNSKRLYVVCNPKMERKEDILDNGTYIVWDLYPVAIWDYVDKDWSDEQGWLQELENGEVQGDMEQVIQYPLVESLEDLLEDEGYEIVDTGLFVSGIYSIEYMKDDPTPKKITWEKAVNNVLWG